MTKKLLQLRKEISARRPKFVQQDHHKRKETQERWRAPKGMHSKMRHGVWGRPASVNVGYRGPQAVRGLHASGLVPVLVYTVAELAALDAKSQGVILGHVGARKKIDILTACQQKGITVLTVKNPAETVQALKDKVTARKEAKKAQKTKKAPAKAVVAEKKQEQPKSKEEERKEAEKIITQRE